MRPTLGHRALPTLAAALTIGILGACGDAATAPTGLTVRAGVAELREAQATDLVALLDGRAVPAGDVAWTSRDTSTVAVRGGVATARAPGSAWLVAQVGGERDSVRVVVRFPTLGANTMAARISGLAGQAEHRFGLQGVSLQYEYAQPVSTLIHAVAGRPANALPDDLFAGDTIVSMRLPGGLALGARRIGSYEVRFTSNIGFWGESGVFVAFDETEDGRSRAYYVAVDSVDLQVTALTLPDERGPGTGSVSGRMTFQAVGLRVRDPGLGQGLVIEPIGDRTFPVYAEFTTTLYRVPLSAGTMRLTGSPYADTLAAGGEATMTERGLEIRNMLLLNADQPGTPNALDATVVVPTPGLGTFSFADTTQARLEGFFAPFIRTPGECCMGQLGAHTDFGARSGTVTITSWRAPTAMAYGELVAEVSAPLDFGAAHPGYAVQLAWVMRVPIRPVTDAYVP
jgi:hypothetical protein